MKRFALAGVVVATVAMFGEVAPAQAAPITYTFTATGSGVLNDVAFSNQLVTFTLFGDTDGVVVGLAEGEETCPLCQENAVTGTIRVGAVTDAIAEPIAALMFPPGIEELGFQAVVALFEAEHGIGMVATFGDAFNGASLATSLGPITAAGSGSLKADTFGEAELTTAHGSFYWTVSPETSTYTATVPEPASLVLLGTGLIALAGGRRVRRHFTFSRT